MVVAVGCVSAATMSAGGASYIRLFVDLPDAVVIAAVVMIMAGFAAWGIVQAVASAAPFAVLEIGDLLLIIGSGVIVQRGMASRALRTGTSGKPAGAPRPSEPVDADAADRDRYGRAADPRARPRLPARGPGGDELADHTLHLRAGEPRAPEDQARG